MNCGEGIRGSRFWNTNTMSVHWIVRSDGNILILTWGLAQTPNISPEAWEITPWMQNPLHSHKKFLQKRITIQSFLQVKSEYTPLY